MPRQSRMNKVTRALPSKVRMIHYVKPRVERLVYLKKLLDDLEEVEVYAEDIFTDIVNPTKFQREFHKRAYEFYTLINDLEERGIIVQDLEEGLIEIPVHMSGKHQYLPWSLNEHNGREPL